jgi:tyrosyl-tRNA synthetase
MLIRQFAKAGHHISFIIGDFTARVGDPTARETGRVPLSSEQIAKNRETYTDQIGRYINLDTVQIHLNSSWLNSMTLQEVFDVFHQVNLTEAMQRDDFRARIKSSHAVSLAEVCYGVLMGIDSVYLAADVEVGGIDQLLNFQQCRKIMRNKGMSEETILMTPILEGTGGDGRKMSKSYNNYIAVNAEPKDKFGGIMSIPDRMVLQYFCSFADVHQREIENLKSFIEKNPLEAKKQLATLLISIETGSLEIGLQEREVFERKFSRRNIDEDKDCIHVTALSNVSLIDLLMSTGQFESKNEIRRLFEQSAVRQISEEDPRILPVETMAIDSIGTIKVGKRRFFKISPPISS